MTFITSSKAVLFVRYRYDCVDYLLSNSSNISLRFVFLLLLYSFHCQIFALLPIYRTAYRCNIYVIGYRTNPCLSPHFITRNHPYKNYLPPPIVKSCRNKYTHTLASINFWPIKTEWITFRGSTFHLIFLGQFNICKILIWLEIEVKFESLNNSNIVNNLYARH